MLRELHAEGFGEADIRNAMKIMPFVSRGMVVS